MPIPFNYLQHSPIRLGELDCDEVLCGAAQWACSIGAHDKPVVWATALRSADPLHVDGLLLFSIGRWQKRVETAMPS